MDCASLIAEEAVTRSIATRNAMGELSKLHDVVNEGLVFFAVNERTRRTWLASQKDVLSRPPWYLPKEGEWDAYAYFLSQGEWDRKNPFRRGQEPPGMQTSTIENPAEVFASQYLNGIDSQKERNALVLDEGDLHLTESRSRRRIEATECRARQQMLRSLATE